jgi:hypothetical protein
MSKNDSLSNSDYIQILKYYKISIPSTNKKIKLEAEKILAEKLCRCIKKIKIKPESRAIGVCTRSIFNKKNLVRGKFNCTKKQMVQIKKRNITLKK